MLALQFLRETRDHEPRPIYAVAGDEPYLRREAVHTIATALLGDDANDGGFLRRYAGDSVALADVLDELHTVPLFAKHSVVVVDDADPFVSAHRKELEAYTAKPASRGTLILVVKTWPANTRLAKLVDSVGWMIDCKTPHERELPAWLVGYAKSRWDLKLDADAARLVVELAGGELSTLVTEIDKLATYVGERRTIGSADVTRMVGTGRVETIWKMLDAATTGDTATALEDLDRLIAAGEQPVALLAAMSASLRKVHHAGALRLRKMDASAACREAGIPPFAVQTTLKQHTHLGPARVASLPEMLLHADLDLKGSSTLAPRAILERLVVNLGQARRD